MFPWCSPITTHSTTDFLQLPLLLSTCQPEATQAHTHVHARSQYHSPHHLQPTLGSMSTPSPLDWPIPWLLHQLVSPCQVLHLSGQPFATIPFAAHQQANRLIPTAPLNGQHTYVSTHTHTQSLMLPLPLAPTTPNGPTASSGPGGLSTLTLSAAYKKAEPNKFARVRKRRAAVGVSEEESLARSSARIYGNGNGDQSKYYRMVATYTFADQTEIFKKKIRIFQCIDTPVERLSMAPDEVNGCATVANVDNPRCLSGECLFPAADICDFLISDRTNTSNLTKFMPNKHKIKLHTVRAQFSKRTKRGKQNKHKHKQISLVLLNANGLLSLLQRGFSTRPHVNTLYELVVQNACAPLGVAGVTAQAEKSGLTTKYKIVRTANEI